MSILRDRFNQIAPSWKKGAPNVAAWMDETTKEIDALNTRIAKLEQAAAGLTIPEPYKPDQVANAVRKILAGLS